MSKVKLTQEQAEIIEETKLALAGFRNDILVRCLNGEYEVEPEFKVGDWVYMDEFSKVAKVVDPYSTGGIRVDDNTFARFSNYRHATPSEIAEEKERRFWKKIGREAKQYKKSDVVSVEGWEGVYEVIDYYGNNDWLITDGFATTENLVGSEALKLVCPVENRLDVTDDE